MNGDGNRELIQSGALQVGDLIELQPGSAIPADGIVISAVAFINQSTLTGESVPVCREEGALVYAVASVFLVDYSCALGLGTPVTFKSIMYRAAQNGILLKLSTLLPMVSKVLWTTTA
ncbi:hypothetical protein [Endozoicomonas sp. YOMI1]|uniref:P-type ATPase n=1 Tax=Endozoicomonas sp. YOMI1 TaxID=2828739 RepID=UPI002149802B